MPQTHILFVDDDVLNQWLATDILSALGFIVTGLCRGAEALKMLEEGYEFDLLLTDVAMPDGVTGFELAEHWRRMQPGRPILYTSTYPQNVLGRLASDEGFIRKHADALDLLAVITELLSMPFGCMAPAPDRRTHYVH